jgi:hypothetical protein
MQAVFMTQDDQQNCTFEPKVGSMNPSRLVKGGAVPAEATVEEMVEGHGPNFDKRHPEIWRKGVVRKANAYFVRGEYDKCMTELSKMNISSIKRTFDEAYKEKWMQAQE